MDVQQILDGELAKYQMPAPLNQAIYLDFVFEPVGSSILHTQEPAPHALCFHYSFSMLVRSFPGHSKQHTCLHEKGGRS